MFGPHRVFLLILFWEAAAQSSPPCVCSNNVFYDEGAVDAEPLLVKPEDGVVDDDVQSEAWGEDKCNGYARNAAPVGEATIGEADVRVLLDHAAG